jgi:hypothetical protein
MILRSTSAAVVFAILATASPLLAADAVYSKDGLALSGYDPVAYFTAGKAEKGISIFETEWGGTRWRFASATNRDAFVASPEKYAPQYGGYCAYAVSRGYTARTDPQAWRIVGDKLYLNYDLKVRDLWEKELPEVITKADRNWPAALQTK